MDLMSMVLGFNRMDNIQPFSASAYLLGMKLIDLLNGLFWPDAVTIDTSRMSVMARCSKHTAINARDELIARGVLMIVSTGKKGTPSTYRMVDLRQENMPASGANSAPNHGINADSVQDKVPMRSLFGANSAQDNGNIKTPYIDHTNQNNGVELKHKRFTPPTPEDVRAYCQKKGYAVDADRFCNFYASKGWRVGNQPMKDWQAAVRTWATRNDARGGERNGNTGQSGIHTYGQPGDSGGGAFHLPDVIL